MKCLFIKSQKFAATGYYGTENPLPDLILKRHRFVGFLSATCWLSSATGSQNALIVV